MSTPEEMKKRREAALARLEKRMENMKIYHENMDKNPELKEDDLVTVISGPYKDMKGRINAISKLSVKQKPDEVLYNVLSMDEKTKVAFPAENLKLLEKQDHARMKASSLMANNPYLVNL